LVFRLFLAAHQLHLAAWSSAVMQAMCALIGGDDVIVFPW
jgi:hypothetical protein